VSESPFEAARAGGLVRPGEPLLVLVSGGGDSVCLLEVAVRLGARVSALHVNYGLREGADADEAFVRGLSERLGVSLHTERVSLPASGNLQDRAREARYAIAERLAEGDYAAAHTASDQAETVLYRLAVSPGSRALHGMAPRRGRLVRPLLGVTRDEVRDYLRARGLEWREDPSNADRRFARARVRHDLLGALREIGPAAERTIAATAAQLREEATLLDRAVDAVLEELGGGPAVPLAALREQPPALRRLVLRRLAGDRPVPDEVLELGERGSRSLDLGEGLRAVAEYGTLRFTSAADPREPQPVELPVPGRARFGSWELEAELAQEGDVSVSAAAIGDVATVRAWRDGDRMRPLGMRGTKTLQDVFTDRRVPRSLRGTLPIVTVDGEVAWVAGVAVSENFRLEPEAERVAVLSAKPV
jgi:tRNA(Ile)-lysidine synthase